jgi:hypothetical protein
VAAVVVLCSSEFARVLPYQVLPPLHRTPHLPPLRLLLCLLLRPLLLLSSRESFFIGALAVAEWTTDKGIKEASYEPIREFVKLTFAASDAFDYTQFYWKFLLAARRTHNPTLKAASERAGEGRWTIAANHVHDPASKKPVKALLWLSEWYDRRTIASIIHIEGWETAKDQDLRNLPAASYPITICWIQIKALWLRTRKHKRLDNLMLFTC